MSITADGWLDFGRREPGPIEKVYSQPNTAQGFVPHSMVGKLAGWYSRLFDMSRLPNGMFTPNAAASVHGSVLLDGTVIQHYPLTASCWASGNRTANTTRIAFEHESVYTNGQPNEEIPFTAPQIDADVRIIKELSAHYGWTPARARFPNVDPDTLMEHNECVTIWGGSPTACPSDRVPWTKILSLLPPPQEDKVISLIKATNANYLWATDGIHKWYVPGPTVLAELQAEGILPTEVKVLSPEAVKAIPTLER